jgi:hypothetical protein
LSHAAVDADGYRAKSKRYSELAVAACDEAQRNLLIKIALRWQRLAEHAESDPYGDEPRVMLP